MSTQPKENKYAGNFVPIVGANISIEQILPTVCLDCDDPSEFLFFNARKNACANISKIDEELFFNANIIITGNNFGCGSDEDHSDLAAKALKDNGFNAIIAGGFGSNFIESCNNHGIVCIKLSTHEILEILKELKKTNNDKITIDFFDSYLWQNEYPKIKITIESNITRFNPTNKIKDYFNISDYPLDLEYLKKSSDPSSPEAKLSKDFKEKYGTQGHLELLDALESRNKIDFLIGSIKMEPVNNEFVISFFKEIYSCDLTMLLIPTTNSVMCDGPDGEIFVCLFTNKRNLSKWASLNKDLEKIYCREMNVSMEMLFEYVMKNKDFGIHLNPDAEVFDLLICHADVQFIKKSFYRDYMSSTREAIRDFLGD